MSKTKSQGYKKKKAKRDKLNQQKADRSQKAVASRIPIITGAFKHNPDVNDAALAGSAVAEQCIKGQIFAQRDLNPLHPEAAEHMLAFAVTMAAEAMGQMIMLFGPQVREHLEKMFEHVYSRAATAAIRRAEMYQHALTRELVEQGDLTEDDVATLAGAEGGGAGGDDVRSREIESKTISVDNFGLRVPDNIVRMSQSVIPRPLDEDEESPQLQIPFTDEVK